ncbi:MAG TPA: hypothetical protein VFL93_07200 [Longimicrobiaceae bacterium]|nr:hypothetical protein [Longimicrobiaceae bacterium]
MGLVKRVKEEAVLARTEIRQGRFQRSMAAVTGFSAVVSGFEAYTQHRRGAFSHWLMWTPVYLTPPTAAAAGAALVSDRVARRVLPALSVVTIADGVIGFIFHVRGIRRMPGGLSVGQYNIVMGPPVFAPLLMCTVGVTGALTGLLRRERKRSLPMRLLGAARHVPALPGRRRPKSEGLAERISHGRFQQLMATTAAVFGVLAGGEAYFEHLRGSFNQRVMWTPVLVTPPMVGAAIGAALSERVAHRVLPAASAVTFADGLLGFALHARGIKRMPGGFENLDFNLAMGPPAFAPLLLCSVGLLGFVAALLRRKEN